MKNRSMVAGQAASVTGLKACWCSLLPLILVMHAATTALGGLFFEPPVSIATLAELQEAECVDLDGDLDHDLIVSTRSVVEIVSLFNNGSGTFIGPLDVAALFDPWYFALGDLDCDSDLDIVLSDTENGDLMVYLNSGAGSFSLLNSYTAGTVVRGVRLGDVDNDNDLDAVVIEANGLFRVFMANGPGSFSPRVTYTMGGSTSSFVLSDIDLDADLDIIAGFTGSLGSVDFRICRNQGNGTFAAAESLTLAGNCRAFALIDVDADEDPDLIASHQFQGVDGIALWTNNGSGVFSGGVRLATGSFTRLVSGDINSDGSPDVIACTSASGSVLLHAGGGAFGSAVTFPVSADTGSIGVRDLDRDGQPDILLADKVSDSLTVIYQTGAPGEPDDRVAVAPVVISRLDHDYKNSRGGSSDRITDTVEFTPSGPGDFTNNSFIASIREGTEVVVRAEAASGFRFVVTPPSNSAWGATTGLSLSGYWLEAGLSDLGTPVPLSFGGSHVFENVYGAPPVAVERRDRVTCDGRRVQVSRYFAPTEPFSFTALELRFPVVSAPPDQVKVYSSVGGGFFGTETEGEEMPDLTVLALQPLLSPEVVPLPPVVIDTLEHQYFENSPEPGSAVVRDLVVFPSGPGIGSAPEFTSTFGPDDELEVRVEASGGRRFRVNPLPNATSQDVQLLMQWIQSFGFIPTNYSPCTIEWVNLSGQAPTPVINQGRTTVEGKTIQVQVKFEVTTAFEFDALVVRFPTNGHPGFEMPRTYPAPGLLASSLFWGQAAGAGMADGVTLELFTPSPPCPADANGDNAVNGADLSVLLSQFGQSVAPGTGGDLNGDGSVNGADLSVLLSNFGTAC